MREIKFRGKRTDNGEWIEGSLYQDHDCPEFASIIPIGSLEWREGDRFSITAFDVDSDTIGQYTEFIDSKQHEICVGDICKYWMDGRWKVGYIFWHRGGFAMHVVKYGDEKVDLLFEFQIFIPVPYSGNVMNDQFEVIGNRWDNPSLLEL